MQSQKTQPDPTDIDQSEDFAPDIILTIRGRPVGYRNSDFGGELLAVERGYFPVSPTGYRSLARCFERGGQFPPPSDSYLEDLAAAFDGERAEALRRARKALRALTADTVTNYINASGAAEFALERGFYAPDAERGPLWQSAYLLCDRIVTTPQLQPTPNGRWSDDQCEHSMRHTRAMHAWLVELLGGRVVAPALPAQGFAFNSYFFLPDRSSPEPTFGLPAIAMDLGFSSLSLNNHDLEPEDDTDDEDGPETDRADSATAAGDQGAQGAQAAPAPETQLALF
jgi:hypothetical protein